MKSRSAAIVPRHLLRGALALCALAVALAATEASASTAANTIITNTATVRYNDAGGVAQTPVTASASVTVTLVPSAPVVDWAADVTIAQGATASLAYTITGTANGPDTYAVTATATETNVTHVDPVVPVGVVVGGTTVAVAAAAGTDVVVPYDGVADAFAHNGIAVGDTIVVRGVAYVVQSISDDPAANTTTIVVDRALEAAIVEGDIVAERATFTIGLASGTVVSGGSGSHAVLARVASTADGSQFTAQPPAAPTIVTVNRPTLTVAKTVSVDGGASYGATGSAAPGTVLVYKVVASNTGATPASAVAFTDVLPAYLTYVAGSGRYATASATSYAAATAVDDDATAPDDGYSWTEAVRTIAFDPGGATGTVAAGGELVLYYQARINP